MRFANPSLAPALRFLRRSQFLVIDRGISLYFEMEFRRYFHCVPRYGGALGARREILAGVENRVVGVVQRIPYLSIF